MRKRMRKLVLSRETLRSLTVADLNALAGGIYSWPTRCPEDGEECSGGTNTCPGYCGGTGGCPTAPGYPCPW